MKHSGTLGEAKFIRARGKQSIVFVVLFISQACTAILLYDTLLEKITSSIKMNFRMISRLKVDWQEIDREELNRPVKCYLIIR